MPLLADGQRHICPSDSLIVVVVPARGKAVLHATLQQRRGDHTGAMHHAQRGQSNRGHRLVHRLGVGVEGECASRLKYAECRMPTKKAWDMAPNDYRGHFVVSHYEGATHSAYST